MEQENTELRQCSNCNKQFPQAKIDLHEAYCCRNIRKCEKCDQMIDIKDIEQHNAEKHTKKPCSHCQGQFEPSQVQLHENCCNMRPAVCKYCENQYTVGQMHRHQQMCGARTKICLTCQKSVMLKDFNEHESRCVRRANERRQQRNEVSQQPYLPRRHNQSRGQRDRQNSTTNNRELANRQKPTRQIIPRATKTKPIVIGPEAIKNQFNPIPISIRMTMEKNQYNNHERPPLKMKN